MPLKRETKAEESEAPLLRELAKLKEDKKKVRAESSSRGPKCNCRLRFRCTPRATPCEVSEFLLFSALDFPTLVPALRAAPQSLSHTFQIAFGPCPVVFWPSLCHATVPTPPSPTPSQSFKLHVGGNLSIPSADATARPLYTPQQAKEAAAAAARDPFDGLPFRAFAERLGAAVAPAMQAARDEQRRAAIETRASAATAPVIVPEVPHLLPFTRWAAQSETIRSTFIAEDPSTRKKARLSWYNPNDGMVPSGWWKGGLLADFQYYNPFNLAGGDSK